MFEKFICKVCKENTDYYEADVGKFLNRIFCNKCFSPHNKDLNNSIIKCPFCGKDCVIFYFNQYSQFCEKHKGYIMKCLNELCRPYDNKPKE